MEKKVPMRTCIACRSVKAKSELIRIVKDGETIRLDKEGKANGRGAYICNDICCIKKLIKNKALNRAFKMEVNQNVYDTLEKDFNGNKE